MTTLAEIYRELESIHIRKKEVVHSQLFEQAAQLRDQEKSLQEEAEKIEAQYHLNLSKSKYVRGMNCLKSLWLYVNHFDQQVISEAQQTIFKQGHRVGELARDLFPNGVLAVPEGEYPGIDSANYTKELLMKGVTTIYEATFIFDRITVAVDILDFKNGRWNVFEVKSTNSVKPIHLKDAALQYYVLKHMPFQHPIEMYIMHFNPKYIRIGDLNLEQLFTAEKKTTDILSLQEDIPSQIHSLKLTLIGNEPSIEIGKQCTNPYPCSFLNYCTNQLPQKEEIKSEIHDDEPIIQRDAIDQFISESEYGIGFLDFETIMPGLPMFDQSRPYQQLVFQYSLHRQISPKNEVTHVELLADHTCDPRLQIIPSLIEHTRELKTIFVYNITFERLRIEEMIRDFPAYADPLKGLLEKLKDLMPIFKHAYRTESMGSQYGIKTVLPIVCPDLSYDDLDISQGKAASDAFLALYDEDDPETIHEVRQHLIKYCTLDTYAMVRLWDVLKGLVNENG